MNFFSYLFWFYKFLKIPIFLKPIIFENLLFGLLLFHYIWKFFGVDISIIQNIFVNLFNLYNFIYYYSGNISCLDSSFDSNGCWGGEFLIDVFWTQMGYNCFVQRKLCIVDVPDLQYLIKNLGIRLLRPTDTIQIEVSLLY